MSAAVTIRAFVAADAVALELQPSQHVTLGIHHAEHSLEQARELEELGPAWTAIGADGRVLACYGFGYQWAPSEKTGGHALAWAMLAADLGAAHVAITRFAREALAESPITRIEAIVRADVDAEWRWAEMVGFRLVAELRCYGPEGANHLLYERVRDAKTHSHPLGNASNRAQRLEALGAV